MPIVREKDTIIKIHGRGLGDDVYEYLTSTGRRLIQGPYRQIRNFLDSSYDGLRLLAIPTTVTILKNLRDKTLPPNVNEIVKEPTNQLLDTISNAVTQNIIKNKRGKRKPSPKLSAPLTVIQEQTGGEFTTAIPGNPIYQSGDALGLGKQGSGIGKTSRKMRGLVNEKSKNIINSLVTGKGLVVL